MEPPGGHSIAGSCVRIRWLNLAAPVDGNLAASNEFDINSVPMLIGIMIAGAAETRKVN